MTAGLSHGDSGAAGSGDLDDVARLRLVLARLARQQRQASPTGLTLSQQSALAVIDRRGPLRLGELARLEQVTAPTITRVVTKLEERGLVSRTVDADDRRISYVTITETGHEQLQETRARRRRWLQARLDALAPADAATILAAVDALERLAEAPGEPS
ncbi:MAG: MarR family transcriptional regulator [Actinomycetota bacterium]